MLQSTTITMLYLSLENRQQSKLYLVLKHTSDTILNNNKCDVISTDMPFFVCHSIEI